MKQSGSVVLRGSPLLRLVVVLFAICSGIVTEAQEIMTVNQASVFSSDSTLILVDAKGRESKSEAQLVSSAGGRVASSNIEPGGRIEVTGGTAAQMIISEAVTARLEPGTQIEIPQLIEGQMPTASLKLLKGKMFITVDAAKLKTTSNVEFRLETPKSLLAVKGTKFVATTEEQADSVALIEGSMAVRDQATKEFVMLRPRQATSVSGEGKLQVRQLTPDESKYSTVFDESELAFVPYQIDPDSISTAETMILPLGKNRQDTSNWIKQPNQFRANAIQFDGFPFKGIRADYVRDEQPYQELHLDLRFSPQRLELAPENSIGVLLKARISGPVEPFINFRVHTENRSVRAQGKLFMRDLQGTQGQWQTYFLGNQSQLTHAILRDEREKAKANLGAQMYTIPASWPNKEQPDRLTIEIASIQIVTLGSEKK